MSQGKGTLKWGDCSSDRNSKGTGVGQLSVGSFMLQWVFYLS